MQEACQDDLTRWLSLLENRHQQEIQLGLERIRQVAEWLDLLHPDSQVITVGGTNGKGSTVAALESVYHHAGYKVASYTSPHLLSFHERIRLNQKPVDSASLITAFECIEQARKTIPLSYFEVATLAALYCFRQYQPDVIILEVGLGGRLDATNIIDSDLAIISTVDLDHQDYLGHTKEAIGYEKAGIIRQNSWFIYADTNIPDSVMNQATALSARSIINGRDYGWHHDGQTLVLQCDDERLVLPRTNVHSAAVASMVMAVRCLQKVLPVSPQQLESSILETRVPGRVQLIQENPQTLIDVAHNPQSAQYLASYLQEHYPGRRILAVFAALGDKDLSGLLKPLLPLVTAWYPARLEGTRAASDAQIAGAFLAHELMAPLCYNSPVLAYQAACREALPDDMLLIYGSFLTVAAVWQHVTHHT